MHWFSKSALAILLIVSSTILSLTGGVPQALATPPSNYYLSANTQDEYSNNVTTLYSDGGTEDGEAWIKQDSVLGGTDTYVTFNGGLPSFWWYSSPYDSLSINAGTWTLNNYVVALGYGGASPRYVDWVFKVGYCNDGADADADPCSSATDYTTVGTSATIRYGQVEGTPTGLNVETLSGSSATPSCSSTNPCRVWLNMYATASNHASASYFQVGYNGSAANYITNLDPPTMSIPENLVFLVAAAPFIPMMVLWLRQRRGIRVVKGS